jgi:hypothetical protein
MLSWRAIREHLVSRYGVAEADDDWLRLTWPEPKGGVEVQVRHLQAEGRERLVIAADIAPASGIGAADAMVLNGRLLVGSLIIAHDILTLRHILTVGWFQGEELHATLATIRDQAAELRAHLARPADATPFTFLAE